MNIPEILSNECFSEYAETNEKRTISTIFKIQICSYCDEVKDDVEDYGDKYYRQGFCSDCAKEVFSEDEFEKKRLK